MGTDSLYSIETNQCFVKEEVYPTSGLSKTEQFSDSIPETSNISASRYLKGEDLPRIIPGENFFSKPTRMGFRSILLGAEGFKISMSTAPAIGTMMFAPASTPLFALAAANLACGVRISVDVDHDEGNDGFPSEGRVSDCNDHNPAIYPRVEEICNEVDDNCDGNIDENVQSTFYQDADGDQYGNPAVSLKACKAPKGYVENHDDCDDRNPSIHPKVEEICNEVDDNCDGNIDENVQSTFYQDADGDQYGNPSVSLYACEAPQNYVSDNTDCNDLDPTIHPYAIDLPDGIDRNCDGQFTRPYSVRCGNDYQTIQEATDAAPVDSVVEICDGSYTEQILIFKSVHLMGIGAVILDGSNFNCVPGTCSSFLPSMFLVVYGTVESLSFDNIQFINGGGITLTSNAVDLRISNSSFRNNPYGDNIPGTQSLIFNYNNNSRIGHFSLSNVEFSDNQCYNCLSLPKMSMDIDNIRVRNNTFVSMLGTDYSDHSIVINHSRFENNNLTLPSTGNPYVSGVLDFSGTPSATALIQDSVFSGNHSLLASAINVIGGHITAMDCVFDGNVVDTSDTGYDSNYASAVLLQFLYPPVSGEASFTSIRSQWNNNSPHDVGITNQVFNGPRASTSYHFETNGSTNFTCSTYTQQCMP